MSNTNTKIIVVVHGIGDQIGYASAQSVAYQFCRYREQPAAIPLGRFHPKFAEDDGKRRVPRPIFIEPPPSGPTLSGLAFTESTGPISREPSSSRATFSKRPSGGRARSSVATACG